MTMLMLMFLVLIMTPFFWDIASMHYTRRLSGAGSDTAVLAAVQEYARMVEQVPQFNGIFLGSCIKQEYTPQQVLLRYLTNPAFQGDPALGQVLALLYADHNLNDLTGFGVELDIDNAPGLFGLPIPVFKISNNTSRQVHTAYGSLYRRALRVPNGAAAAAYLSAYLVIPQPCPGGFWTYDFWLEWKFTLFAAGATPTVQLKCVASEQAEELGFVPARSSKKYRSDKCTVRDRGKRDYAKTPPLYCTLPPTPGPRDARNCAVRVYAD